MGIKDNLAKILYYPIKAKNINKIKKIYRNNQVNFTNLKKIDLNKDLKKTLILFPHVDDETIGLGGMLVKNISNNKIIDLLYMTDSSGSLGNENEDIKKIRQNEAEQLKEKLNLNELRILDIKNNDVTEFNEYAINKLTEILETKKYENIFIISPFDAHSEHRWSNYILSSILKTLNFKGSIYLYEVSNLLPFSLINNYIEIDLDKKNNLYSLFNSQKYTMDFDVFNQLNKHKGLSIDSNKPVEFFSKLNRDEYLEIIDRLKKSRIEEKLIYRIGNHRSFYKISNNEKKLQEFYNEILNK